VYKIIYQPLVKLKTISLSTAIHIIYTPPVCLQQPEYPVFQRLWVKTACGKQKTAF
jgi:hypothetical protein